MENLNLNQDMKIAGNLTISNWNKLSKNLNCLSNNNWSDAFQYFEERIKTRYINPIKSILDIGYNQSCCNVQASIAIRVLRIEHVCYYPFQVQIF